MEEPPKTKAVAGYGEVVEMPLEEQVQPLSGRGDGIVHSFAQFHLQRLKLRHHPFLDRLAPDDKSPGLGSRAEMREAEEVESLRLPLPSLFALLGREAAEADQPGLGWMQRQFELAQALVQILQERPGLVLMLKAGDEVVRVADDDHVAARLILTPAIGPQIERIVQVNICQSWRNDRPLRSSPHAAFDAA